MGNDNAYNARLGVAAGQLILAIILIVLSLTSVPGGTPIVFVLLVTGGSGVGASLTKNKGLEAIFLLGSIGSIIAMIIVLFITVLASAFCSVASDVVGILKCQSCAEDYGSGATGKHNCTGTMDAVGCDTCKAEGALFCKTATYSSSSKSRSGGCYDKDSCWVVTQYTGQKCSGNVSKTTTQSTCTAYSSQYKMVRSHYKKVSSSSAAGTCYANTSSFTKYTNCKKYTGRRLLTETQKPTDSSSKAVNKVCDHIDMVKYASFLLLFLLFMGCGMSSYFLCCMKEEKEVQHASGPGRDSSDMAKF